LDLLIEYYAARAQLKCLSGHLKHTYDGAQREAEYLIEADMGEEERHFGRLAGWLLERLVGVGVIPILVVAVRGQVEVKTALDQLSDLSSPNREHTLPPVSHMACRETRSWHGQ
jgi:hypothetical protein